MITDNIYVNGYQLAMKRSEVGVDSETFYGIQCDYQQDTVGGKTITYRLLFGIKGFFPKYNESKSVQYYFGNHILREVEGGNESETVVSAVAIQTILSDDRTTTIDMGSGPVEVGMWTAFQWLSEQASQGLVLPGHLINSIISYVCQQENIMGIANPLYVPTFQASEWPYMEGYASDLTVVQPLVVYLLSTTRESAEGAGDGATQFRVSDSDTTATYTVDGGTPQVAMGTINIDSLSAGNHVIEFIQGTQKWVYNVDVSYVEI